MMPSALCGREKYQTVHNTRNHPTRQTTPGYNFGTEVQRKHALLCMPGSALSALQRCVDAIACGARSKTRPKSPLERACALKRARKHEIVASSLTPTVFHVRSNRPQAPAVSPVVQGNVPTGHPLAPKTHAVSGVPHATQNLRRNIYKKQWRHIDMYG